MCPHWISVPVVQARAWMLREVNQSPRLGWGGVRAHSCPGLCASALSTLPLGPVVSRSFRDAQGPVPQSGCTQRP